MAEGPEAGLDLLRADDLVRELDGYVPYHGALADLSRRAGHTNDALAHYSRSHALSTQDAERRYFDGRIRALRGGAEG